MNTRPQAGDESWNPLASQIQDEIRLRGPISFARFMELALYAPRLGYYETANKIGRSGDFFTSVSVGPLFAQLLAFQFAQWMDAQCPEGDLQFVEAGPHNGALAADILRWMQHHRPDLFERIEYCLLESSPIRKEWQEEKLRPWLPKMKWAPNLHSWPDNWIRGIIFSNEFLDALPVHCLSWNAASRKWMECFVAANDESFTWELGEPGRELADQLPSVPDALASVLLDGFKLEVCPAANNWWREAASKLAQGKLLTIDYGLIAEERFSPERAQGTLRAYFRHHLHDDVLANVGQQDLTAHVDFSALEEIGRAAGLRTETLTRQSKFLTDIFAQTQSIPGSFGPWNENQTRQFQTLTHPEHLGHKFRVLVQTR